MKRVIVTIGSTHLLMPKGIVSGLVDQLAEAVVLEKSGYGEDEKFTPSEESYYNEIEVRIVDESRIACSSPLVKNSTVVTDPPAAVTPMVPSVSDSDDEMLF